MENNKPKSFLEENEEILLGATPLLVGMLSGEMGIGADIAGDTLIDDYRTKRKANMDLMKSIKMQSLKSEGASNKPLTKSNVTEILGPDGRPQIVRIEDAINQTTPDKFHLDKKKSLSRFNKDIDRADSQIAFDRQEEINRPKRQFQQETRLKKDFESNKVTKNTRDLGQSYRKLKQLLGQPQNSINDLSVMIYYMKMLDPGSTVRETEAASVANATNVPASVRHQYNRLFRGEDAKMPQEVRTNIRGTLNGLYSAQLEAQEGVTSDYKALASKYGLDPELLVNIPKVEMMKTQEAGTEEEDLGDAEDNTTMGVNYRIIRNSKTGEYFKQYMNGELEPHSRGGN